MSCVSERELLEYVDAQATTESARLIEAHLSACSSCAERRRALVALTRAIASPPTRSAQSNLAQHEFGARVWQRIDAAESAARRSWRWPALLGAGAVATAALVMALLLPRSATEPMTPDDVGTFRARGGATASELWRTARAQVEVQRGDASAPLVSGAALGPQDRLAVRCTNLAREAVHLMVFAIDGQGAVHWFFPAYQDAASDPAAVLLPSGMRAERLPELVRPEAGVAGPLRVVAVLSRRARHVKAVEARLAGKRARDGVAERFGANDNVQEWLVELTPDGTRAGGRP